MDMRDDDTDKNRVTDVVARKLVLLAETLCSRRRAFRVTADFLVSANGLSARSCCAAREPGEDELCGFAVQHSGLRRPRAAGGCPPAGCWL